MRVILDREDKREEPPPPSALHSSVAATGVAGAVAEGNAIVNVVNLPSQQRDALQNSPPNSSTNSATGSADHTLPGSQRRVIQSTTSVARETASTSTEGQPSGTNGKQRAPESGGEASETKAKNANSDDDDDDDEVGVSDEAEQRTNTQLRRRGGSGAAGSAEVVSSSLERDACLT